MTFTYVLVLMCNCLHTITFNFYSTRKILRAYYSFTNMSMNFLPVYSQLILEDGNPRQSVNIQQRDNEPIVNNRQSTVNVFLCLLPF